jgi:hypothetical protein
MDMETRQWRDRSGWQGAGSDPAAECSTRHLCDVVTLGAIAPSQLIEAPGYLIAEFESLGEVSWRIWPGSVKKKG